MQYSAAPTPCFEGSAMAASNRGIVPRAIRLDEQTATRDQIPIFRGPPPPRVALGGSRLAWDGLYRGTDDEWRLGRELG